jgi:hypothetical protein
MEADLEPLPQRGIELWVLPPEKPRKHCDVTGRRDREELCGPLNRAQDESVR